MYDLRLFIGPAAPQIIQPSEFPHRYFLSSLFILMYFPFQFHGRGYNYMLAISNGNNSDTSDGK